MSNKVYSEDKCSITGNAVRIYAVQIRGRQIRACSMFAKHEKMGFLKMWVGCISDCDKSDVPRQPQHKFGKTTIIN